MDNKLDTWAATVDLKKEKSNLVEFSRITGEFEDKIWHKADWSLGNKQSLEKASVVPT